MKKISLAFILMAVALGLGAFTRKQQSLAQEPPSSATPADAGGHGAGDFPNLSREHEFDGIDISKYANFWDKWHLVTVRYRKDNNEQRFVYANNVAYQAMKAGKKVYPDGAMFGKVAFQALEDKAFPNSLEPNGVTRIQLMKKDKAKYPKSNGWGYALYMKKTGVDYNDIESTVVSCHACHRLVPNRDFVFSYFAFNGTWKPQAAISFSSRFTDIPVSELESALKNALASSRVALPDTAHVKVLQTSLFDGAVDENTSPLIEYARKDQLPYLVIDEKNHFFIVAVPVPGDPAVCPNEVRLARVRSMHAKSDPTQKAYATDHGRACGEKVMWERSHILRKY